MASVGGRRFGPQRKDRSEAQRGEELGALARAIDKEGGSLTEMAATMDGHSATSLVANALSVSPLILSTTIIASHISIGFTSGTTGNNLVAGIYRIARDELLPGRWVARLSSETDLIPKPAANITVAGRLRRPVTMNPARALWILAVLGRQTTAVRAYSSGRMPSWNQTSITELPDTLTFGTGLSSDLNAAQVSVAGAALPRELARIYT